MNAWDDTLDAAVERFYQPDNQYIFSDDFASEFWARMPEIEKAEFRAIGYGEKYFVECFNDIVKAA